MRFCVNLLGAKNATYGDEPFAFRGRRMALPLLAFLLVHRDEDLARDFVAFTFWPDEPEDTARAKLRATVHELLRILPPGQSEPWLIAGGINLRWNPETDVAFDVTEFERACARDDVELALALYRGDLLEDVHDEWVAGARARLRATFVAALERGVASARETGDGERAAIFAERLLALDPYREDVLRRLMTLHVERGDRDAALARFDRFEALVRESLGVEPMAETQSLRDAIAGERGRFELRTDARDPGVFVGRERELARLHAAWSRARGKRGGITFLGGEAGSGKTALVAQFARTVAESGGRVLIGTTASPEALPYECAIDALRGALPLVAALRLAPAWAVTLATLLPELAGSFRNPASLAELDGEARGDRVRETIARTVLALAATRPVLLVLEDLHWAGDATFAMIADLARRVSAAPVAIVVTYRNDEVHRAHPFARTIREATAQPGAERLDLGALGRDDVAALLERAGRPLAGAGAVFAVSRGNAFFASQLATADDGDAIPENVAQFVAARVERLPADAREAAEIAALLGAQFSRACLRDVAAWTESRAGDALDELIARRLVRELAGRAALDYAFAHQVVCDVVAAREPGSRERHARAARALEDHLPALAPDIATKIAGHYERAGDAPQAVRNYIVAARRALDLGAQADAETSLERGLALAPDATSKIALLKLAVEASARSDVTSERRLFDRLDDLANALDDDALRDYVLVRRVAAGAREAFSAEVERNNRALRARAKVRDDPGMGALADYFEGMHNVHIGSTRLGVEQLERSLPHFERSGDALRTTRAHVGLLWAYHQSGRFAEYAAMRAHVDAIANDRSAPYAVRIAAISGPINVAVDAGDVADAERVARTWLAAALEAGDRREEVKARDQLAWPLLAASRCAAALGELDTAIGLCAQLGFGDDVPHQINRGVILLRLGAFDAAREAIEASGYAGRPPVAQTTARSTLVLVEGFSGNFAAAREHAEFAFAALRDTGDRKRLAALLENLADAERLAGDAGAAIALGRKALAERNAARLPAAGRVAFAIALTEARTGRLEAARATLATVPEPEQTLRATYWRDRLGLYLAQSHHAIGDSAEAQRWLAYATAESQAVSSNLPEPWAGAYAGAWWVRELASARAGDWHTLAPSERTAVRAPKTTA